MVYACDLKWWDEYAAEVEKLPAERWTVDVAAQAKHGLHHVEGVHDIGLCERPGRIFLGGNSGYQAVGLAHEWGARRIVLLGFDMQATGGRQHWHPDHPARLGNGGNFDAWQARFEVLARDLKSAGVQAVNATRSTALTCFHRDTLDAALDPRPRHIHIQGMQGLGDNIYQRAVLRELCLDHHVYLETSWPELYEDLPLIPVRPLTHLRTQARNISTSNARWGSLPAGIERRSLTYAGASGTIVEALLTSVGLQRSELLFDLPPLESGASEPYVIVRPVTVRREWPAPSRNPKPEYVARAAQRLRNDFKVISVADLADGEEWAKQPMPPADEVFHAGELSIKQLLALVAGASGVVGGVGWMVPAAIALRIPMLLIFGGWGAHNGPDRIFDARLDTSLIKQLIPDRFCMCESRDHGCDKEISHIDQHIDDWAQELSASAVLAARSKAA